MSDQEKIIASGETKKRSSAESFEKSIEDSGHAETTVVGLNMLDRWAAKLNAETKGIELITDEEKNDSSILNAATMWLSANLVIATFSLGALGVTVFALSLFQCIMTIFFFSLLGAMPVAFFSVFGCKLGLRQMILSKFLLGDYGMRVFAAINMIACVGWGAVNIMASA